MNHLMKAQANSAENAPTINEKVKNFYDIGSPYYLKLFGTHIHDGYFTSGKESRKKAQENLIKFLVDKAKIEKGSRILDVGCGIGGSSIWLAKNLNAITVGITISPVQIDIANKLAHEQKVNPSFLLMNAEEMDFPEPFDAIWLVAALTHFSNQERFLKLSSQFLKKQGKIIIYDWMVSENITDSEKDMEIRQVMEGLVLANLYSHNTYLTWLKDYGYRILYTEDLTTYTIKTWDVPLSLMKNPATWKLFTRMNADQTKEVFTFLKGRKAIKQAELNGNVKSVAIVAEKML